MNINPQTKYKIEELFGSIDGNDDILLDIGNTGDVRHIMPALDPPKVGDGEEYVNEEIPEPYIPDDEVVTILEGEEILTEIYNKNIADVIANKVAEKYNLGNPQYIGAGMNGVAYDIGNDRILKITSDTSEANESRNLIGKSLKFIANQYKVYSITPKSDKSIPETYVIILEKLETAPEYFQRLFNKVNFAFEKILNIDLQQGIDYFLFDELSDNEDINKIEKYLSKNKEDYEFFHGLLNIAQEANENNLMTIDYYNPKNLGYKKDGSLGFFDVGYANSNISFDKQPEEIEIEEDGTSLYSTDGDIGQDGYSTYNNNDSSDLLDNNIRTTDDEIVERVLSSMKGSSTVNVKKRCRLAGNGNTSTACNQGDIKNLNIKPLSELFDDYTDEIVNQLKKGKNEGVADKYLEKEFGLSPEYGNVQGDMSDYEDIANRQANRENREEIFQGKNKYGDKVKLIKNPKSLSNIGFGVRGVIDKEGNLYVEEKMNLTHSGIISYLVKHNLITYQPRWGFEIPQEFATVVRIGKKNIFALGESNEQMTPMEDRNDPKFVNDPKFANYWKTIADYESSKQAFQIFLDKAKQKNPNIDFIDRMIDYANPEKNINEEDNYEEEIELININLKTLKPELAQAAQKVYDEWDQNEEGYCDWLGEGGICQDIAEAMCNVLYKHNVDCMSVSQLSGEQHVYVVARTIDGVFNVDIPPYLYEEGGGYCWKKIPDVEFDERYVTIDRLDSDPNNYYQYGDIEESVNTITEEMINVGDNEVSLTNIKQRWNNLDNKAKNNKFNKSLIDQAVTTKKLTPKQWWHLDFLFKNGKSAYEAGALPKNLEEVIKEEIENVSRIKYRILDKPITIYHGSDIDNLKNLIINPSILSPNEKQLLPSNTGGYNVGLSTSTDIYKAKKYSNSLGNNKILKMELLNGAKIIEVDTNDKGLDEIFTMNDLENYQNHNIDAIIELDDFAENEVRLLSMKHVKIDKLV